MHRSLSEWINTRRCTRERRHKWFPLNSRIHHLILFVRTYECYVLLVLKYRILYWIAAGLHGNSNNNNNNVSLTCYGPLLVIVRGAQATLHRCNERKQISEKKSFNLVNVPSFHWYLRKNIFTFCVDAVKVHRYQNVSLVIFIEMVCPVRAVAGDSAIAISLSDAFNCERSL